MSQAGRGLHHPRLAIGARVLALAILAVPVLLLGQRTALVAVLALAAIWCLSTLADRLSPSRLLYPVLEAFLVGAVAARALADGATVLGALAVPAFTAGLRSGVRGWRLPCQPSWLRCWRSTGCSTADSPQARRPTPSSGCSPASAWA